MGNVSAKSGSTGSRDAFCTNSLGVPSVSAATNNMNRYFSGEALFGDNFAADEVAQWFTEEKEASYEIRGGMKEYPYHARNRRYGYRRLPSRKFDQVLAFGGGNGAELLPIADRLGKVTILEPSGNFEHVIPADRVAPSENGILPFADNTFELVTCLGVLHHIPNVSAVIRELYRCTARGGFMLLSEPIVSMGDWRVPRVGLTKRERGIPLHLLRCFLSGAGFDIVSEDKCSFGLLNYISSTAKVNFCNSSWMVAIDGMLCRLPLWSNKYHATTVFDRFRPTAVFSVLRK